MKKKEAPSVKVPLVIPREQAFAWTRRDRIILPTLMPTLPGMPPLYCLGSDWNIL